MGIKVKAMERNVNFAKKGAEDVKPKYMFIMQPELYGKLDLDKVIAQAALNCGMPKVAMQTAVNAYGMVVSDWATEGHSVPIPGLGTLRFGVRSNAVSDVTEVKSSLITSRRLIFTPSSFLKKVLAETSVSITCYDRNGKIVKTVTSEDKDDIEDPDNENNENAGGNQQSGSQTPSEDKDNPDSGSGTDSGSSTDSGSGSSTGSDTGEGKEFE